MSHFRSKFKTLAYQKSEFMIKWLKTDEIRSKISVPYEANLIRQCRKSGGGYILWIPKKSIFFRSLAR